MERRKYKSKLKQPLSLDLPTKSISVPGKGVFVLDKEDWVSPVIAKRVSEGILVLVETLVEVEIEEAPKVEEKPPEPEGDGAKDAANVQQPCDMDAENKEQNDDSLTSSKDVVELTSEEIEKDGSSEGEDKKAEPSEKKTKRSRRRKKASRE